MADRAVAWLGHWVVMPVVSKAALVNWVKARVMPR